MCALIPVRCCSDVGLPKLPSECKTVIWLDFEAAESCNDEATHVPH